MIGWAYDHYGVFSWVPEMASVPDQVTRGLEWRMMPPGAPGGEGHCGLSPV